MLISCKMQIVSMKFLFFRVDVRTLPVYMHTFCLHYLSSTKQHLKIEISYKKNNNNNSWQHYY